MAQRESGFAVLLELEGEGFRFRVVDGVLNFKPSAMSSEQVARLAPNLAEVTEIVAARQRVRPSGDKFAAYRNLVPKFWDVFRTADGRCGLFYGVTPFGVLLLVGGSVHSFQPDEVEPVEM